MVSRRRLAPSPAPQLASTRGPAPPGRAAGGGAAARAGAALARGRARRPHTAAPPGARVPGPRAIHLARGARADGRARLEQSTVLGTSPSSLPTLFTVGSSEHPGVEDAGRTLVPIELDRRRIELSPSCPHEDAPVTSRVQVRRPRRVPAQTEREAERRCAPLQPPRGRHEPQEGRAEEEAAVLLQRPCFLQGAQPPSGVCGRR